MKAPLIEFVDVTKRFEDRTVLYKVNARIYENEITTVIGKSGTGKSVFLKHMIGLLKPDEGAVLFEGKPMDSMSRREWDAYRSRIAYLFQGNALLDSMTVYENVALPLRQTTRLGRSEIEKRVLRRMEDLELTREIHKYPAELSGGMQKRVALARALVTDPKIVLFDEPTTGQDPIRKNMILSMISHYRRRFGFTAVLVSHDIPDVFFISDRIVILWEGSIGFEGTYDELVTLKHPMIDEFLKSLEGFGDELTGLLSREAFKVQYGALPGKGTTAPAVSAALFQLETDHLQEHAGHQAASEVLKTLGEFANAQFKPVGGFSARCGRNEILTVFPGTTREEAERLVEGFGRELQGRPLQAIEREARLATEENLCIGFHISAGVTEVSLTDKIDEIVKKAQARQRILATHLCDVGGRGQ
jgi:phospholipid/cholesterol/gamma-HCH transport system ATP-binding protein